MTPDDADIWKPHLTVAAVVERHGRFLMVEEDIDGERVINQPAGHLEAGESLFEAVVRETLEETAWHVRPTALVAIYRWRAPAGTTFIRVTFAADALRHEPDRRLDTGIHRALWLTPQEVGRARIRSPMVRRCIDDYRHGHRYPLALLQDLATGGG
jgi:8-oxo-dGTP pyrophosphatase MutT (NUDIX family)